MTLRQPSPEADVDLRRIQHLLGHTDFKATMIDSHTVGSRRSKEMVSPLDLELDPGAAGLAGEPEF